MNLGQAVDPITGRMRADPAPETGSSGSLAELIERHLARNVMHAEPARRGARQRAVAVLQRERRRLTRHELMRLAEIPSSVVTVMKHRGELDTVGERRAYRYGLPGWPKDGR